MEVVTCWILQLQLLRLQGRQRHGREAIHIIDVHGDDQRSEVEVARNLTEEQNEGALSRKKKDMPTRQQKNKHQITYLAYKVRHLYFLWFPFCRGEAGLVVTPLYDYFCINKILGPCCWPFLSTFLPSLPFLELSSHNPPISAVFFLVLCNCLASLLHHISSLQSGTLMS